jgi:arsenate reductase
MIKIYHNPRCRKSKEGVQILENSGKEFEIVKYLETSLTVKELTEILNYLNSTPIDLVRKTEKIWKENFKGKDLSDNEIIKIMTENPKLIERPIVVQNKKAVVGRPPSNILEFI